MREAFSTGLFRLWGASFTRARPSSRTGESSHASLGRFPQKQYKPFRLCLSLPQVLPATPRLWHDVLPRTLAADAAAPDLAKAAAAYAAYAATSAREEAAVTARGASQPKRIEGKQIYCSHFPNTNLFPVGKWKSGAIFLPKFVFVFFFFFKEVHLHSSFL